MSRRLTTDEFIKKSQSVHGDRYDYSSVNYVNNHTNVAINCPDHGPFTQTPNKHLSRQGCPDCGGNKPLTTETFVEQAKAIHGDRYDYSDVEYVNANTHVTIICHDHGPFPQVPRSHILQKSGCPDCGGTKQLTTETFIDKAIAVHGDRYDYSSVNYVNNHTNVAINCPDHGPFPQTPTAHLSNVQGCPDCAGNKPLTTETFVEQAKAIHGDRH